jgi:hypothetical protein
MQFAGFLSLLATFWNLTSTRLLTYDIEKWSFLEKYSDTLNTNHIFYQYLNPIYAIKNSGPALPILIYIWCFLIFVIFEDRIMKILRKLKVDIFDESKFDYVEGFRPYF